MSTLNVVAVLARPVGELPVSALIDAVLPPSTE